VPWLLVEGQQKMLVIGIPSVSGTWQNNNFLMSFFPTIITKEILEKNVAFSSFMGRIAIVVAKRYDGCSRMHCFNPSKRM
jgi:hypothetical protein